MTIHDETRFRHLAACIATAAQHLQVDQKPNHQDIANIWTWTDEMAGLYENTARTQKGASRSPAKKERDSRHAR